MGRPAIPEHVEALCAFLLTSDGDIATVVVRSSLLSMCPVSQLLLRTIINSRRHHIQLGSFPAQAAIYRGSKHMPLVFVGLLLIALKAAEIGPFAACPWWLAVTPLVLAILWWKLSDASGLNKRREMDRMEERKAQRRKSLMTATGQGPEAEREKRDAERALAARQREIDRVEGRRAKVRAKARDSLLGSRIDSELPQRPVDEVR